MKHVLLGVLLLVCGNLSAQEDERRFTGALVAGFSLNQIDGDLLTGYHNLGISAGAKVNAKLSQRWQLSIELLYAQEGASRAELDNPNAALDKIRLNYVQVPVMISLLEWKFHVSTGLSYNQLINFETIDIFGADVSADQRFANANMSFLLDVLYFTNEHWGFNFRWKKDLTNIQESDANGTFIGRNIVLRGLYRF